MLTSEVKKLDPPDQFLYWIKERHQVYLRRKENKPKPWTDDEVLQQFFFTNPYREHDKVTVWFKRNLREPLRNDIQVVFATIAFRWFNLPSTGEILMDGAIQDWDNSEGNLFLNWDEGEAVRRLSEVRDRGGKVFTGAFMINSPGGESKLEAIARRITNVWDNLPELLPKFQGWKHNLMEHAHNWLMSYEGLGGFMAYEVVCDLRYTVWLEGAPDKDSWCNPGPGAIRGLYRIAGESWGNKGNNSSAPPRPKDWQERMKDLLALVRRRLHGMPPFEMREIEHSLCEYDKYIRALEGDGRLKRRYSGGAS